MAQIPLEIRPGIVKELTPTANKGGWSDGDKVRFFQGMPEAIGGWIDSSNGATFSGVARGVHQWTDLGGNVLVAVGTNTGLYVWQGGVFFDVTPIQRQAIISNPFSTTVGSNVVTVTDTGETVDNGNLVSISNTDPVAGMTISGVFVATVLSPTQFQITVPGDPANASVTGGGANVVIDYYIPSGPTDGQLDTGYGVGGYGVGTYGTPRTSNIERDPRTWCLDNWGEDLVASYSGGPLFVWKPSLGTAVRASVIGTAPQACEGFVVSQPDRHLVTIGSSLVGAQDYLNINFCDRDDYTVWNALDTNQAGSQRAPGGSRLMQVVTTRGEMLVLSDTHAHALRFVGSPYVFGLFPMGANCGAISKKSAVDASGVVYWMGPENFHRYDGRVTTVACPMRDYVFGNIDKGHRAKVFAVYIKKFNEVWWFYQANGDPDTARFIATSLDDQSWFIGTLTRTCATDGGPLGYPIMCGTDGKLYFHENGSTADGADLLTYLESADFRYGPGDKFFFTDKVIPDFQNLGPKGVGVTIKWRRYPNEAQSSKGPYTVLSTTKWFNTRVRSKQQSIRIDGTGSWRMGLLTFNIQPDGER